MKITCVLGSPRPKGNSAVMAKRFGDTAEKLGAQVQTFVLNELQYRGCTACMGCKTKADKCVLQDDLTPVLESVREGDVLVMASPVYLWDVTSLLRGFIERTYSYFVPDFAYQPESQPLKTRQKARLHPDSGAAQRKHVCRPFLQDRAHFQEVRLYRQLPPPGTGGAETWRDCDEGRSYEEG